MSRISIPSDLLGFARVFQEAGRQIYFVGGAIRDSLLGRPASDFDAATDARPEEVQGLFRKVIPTGIKHGTVTVLWKGRSVETTTFRSETGYADGRHPDRVSFGSSIEEDLERRDFTINAMAYEPIAGWLVDPRGGRRDLEARLIRAVGRASDRFAEDGLRILRAIRFATQLDFSIEEETFAALSAAREGLAKISAERLRDEVLKMLAATQPSRGLRLMEKAGILGIILPELAACRGVEQKGLHRFDVLDHLLYALDAAPSKIELRLAALFHDIGKPESYALGEDGRPTFYRHEEYSASISEAILKRLRLPRATVEQVCHLIRQHMFHYEESWTDAAVRRFLARVGKDAVPDLLALRLADSAAHDGRPADPRSLEPLRERMEALLEREDALGIRDLAIGGNDLAELGIPKGPVMGRVLAELLDAVLDDSGLNTRERLLDIATRLRQKHGVIE